MALNISEFKLFNTDEFNFSIIYDNDLDAYKISYIDQNKKKNTLLDFEGDKELIHSNKELIEQILNEILISEKIYYHPTKKRIFFDDIKFSLFSLHHTHEKINENDDLNDLIEQINPLNDDFFRDFFIQHNEIISFFINPFNTELIKNVRYFKNENVKDIQKVHSGIDFLRLIKADPKLDYKKKIKNYKIQVNLLFRIIEETTDIFFDQFPDQKKWLFENILKGFLYEVFSGNLENVWSDLSFNRRFVTEKTLVNQMWSEFVSNLSFEIRTIAICCLAKLKISYCHEYSGILLLYSLLYSKDQLYYLNSVKKLYQTLDLNEQDIDYDSLRRSYETLQRYYNVFKNVKTKLEKQISNGESKTLEFKETLSLDLKNQVKEKGIELSSLKTITGFLNSDGGDLLIGINDNGEIKGIKYEVNKLYKSSNDKYLQHVRNLIKSNLGEDIYPLIDFSILQINNQDILKISCIPSTKPIWLNGSDFYVRTNPATDKLDGKKQYEYIQNKFKN